MERNLWQNMINHSHNWFSESWKRVLFFSGLVCQGTFSLVLHISLYPGHLRTMWFLTRSELGARGRHRCDSYLDLSLDALDQDTLANSPRWTRIIVPRLVDWFRLDSGPAAESSGHWLLFSRRSVAGVTAWWRQLLEWKKDFKFRRQHISSPVCGPQDQLSPEIKRWVRAQ